MLETGGNPAVFGERRVPGAERTVLIYCHYDTKPVPTKGWLQPNPLEPVFRARPADEGAQPLALSSVADDELGRVFLHARGASDDKGPIWSHLHAIELMDACGITPAVNVKVITLDEGPQGYKDFDKGAATKYVIDPHGSLKK